MKTTVYKTLLKKIKRIKLNSFVKPFLIVLAIYCFAMLAIWRAGVSYVDDNGRAIMGYGWTYDFNRLSSSLLSFVFIQFQTRLVDISPLSQIIAMIFLTIATLIIVELFGKKEKLSNLIVATLIGLTPFTVNLWLYKFDAPCMALALLSSVLPFAFKLKKDWHFAALSFVCLMVMLTSYQAFAGVFPLILFALAFRDYLEQKKFDWRRIVAGMIGFAIALVVFKFVLPEPQGYRSLEMFGLMNFIPGVIHNSIGVFGRIFEMFGVNWLIMLGMMVIVFIVSIFINSRRNGRWKFVELLVAVAFILISIPLSYGLYLALADAPLNTRSLVGIGVVFAIIALLALRGKKHKWLFAFPGITVVYLFVTYAFALGNALKYQDDYSSFRNQELALRLSEIYPDREELAARRVQIQGDIGLARQAEHLAKMYPIVRDVIDGQQTGLSFYYWGTFKLYADYGFEYDYLGSLDAPYDCDSMDTKYDGYYERISDDGPFVCVEIKN